jgi:hypothetical protein
MKAVPMKQLPPISPGRIDHFSSSDCLVIQITPPRVSFQDKLGHLMLRSSRLISLIVGRSLFPNCFAVDSPKPAAADYSKEAFVLEQSSDKFKFENDGTYTRVMVVQIRVQSDAGVQQLSVVKFAYQSSSQLFAVDYVRVTKPDGTVVVTPPDTFQDMPADINPRSPLLHGHPGNTRCRKRSGRG